MTFDEPERPEQDEPYYLGIGELTEQTMPIIAGDGACPYCDCHAFIPSPGDDSKCGRPRCGHKWVDHY